MTIFLFFVFVFFFVFSHSNLQIIQRASMEIFLICTKHDSMHNLALKYFYYKLRLFLLNDDSTCTVMYFKNKET